MFTTKNWQHKIGEIMEEEDEFSAELQEKLCRYITTLLKTDNKINKEIERDRINPFIEIIERRTKKLKKIRPKSFSSPLIEELITLLIWCQDHMFALIEEGGEDDWVFHFHTDREIWDYWAKKIIRVVNRFYMLKKRKEPLPCTDETSTMGRPVTADEFRTITGILKRETGLL